MLLGTRYSTSDVIAILLRRRWLVLVPFAVGLALPVIMSSGPILAAGAGQSVSAPLQEARLGALGASAVAGLLIGLALVGLLEYRRSDLVTERHVSHAMSLPVLGTVPVMASARERRRTRRFRIVMDVLGSLVLGAAVFLVVWRLAF